MKKPEYQKSSLTHLGVGVRWDFGPIQNFDGNKSFRCQDIYLWPKSVNLLEKVFTESLKAWGARRGGAGGSGFEGGPRKSGRIWGEITIGWTNPSETPLIFGNWWGLVISIVYCNIYIDVIQISPFKRIGSGPTLLGIPGFCKDVMSFSWWWVSWFRGDLHPKSYTTPGFLENALEGRKIRKIRLFSIQLCSLGILAHRNWEWEHGT